MKYDLSVIIPVRNDCLVYNALESIKDEVEVIVSLNDPSEEVLNICECWAQKDKVFTLKIVLSSKIGMPVGLNNGVKAAENSKIIVLDSDCVVTTSTLKEYDLSLEHASFVRGKTKVKEKAGLWYSQTKLGVEAVNYNMQNQAMLYGPSIAFRKEEFLKLNGYDEDILYGCDHKFSDKVRKNNYEILYWPEAIIWHNPIDFKTDKKSHIGYGVGNNVHDKKTKSFDGLKYIFSKISITTIINKFNARGFGGVLRTFMQFLWMLKGYMKSNYEKEI